MHELLPPVDTSPAGQSVHSVLPDEEENFPAVHETQDDVIHSDANEPAVHGEHDVAFVDEYRPGGQVEQKNWPVYAAYWPAAQLSQVEDVTEW